MSRESIRLPWQRDADIFLVSVLILYLELVLIRWIGTEIRIFAYLGNLVLVVCFFGVGLGCYQMERTATLSRLGINLFLLVGLISNPFHFDWLDLKQVTLWLSGFDDSPIWKEMSGLSGAYVVAGFLIVGVLMYLVTFTFVPLGQMLGRALQEHPRTIRAYSINIAGSLFGVWLFNTLSWASTPPGLWFAVAGVVTAELVVSVGAQRGWLAVALVMITAGLTWLGNSARARTIWSPYQKLIITPFVVREGTNQVPQGYLMNVNGVFYQHVLDLSDAFADAHPEVFDKDLIKRSHYNLPFYFKSHVKRILIVGAGAGNNAAAALRHGVEEVDCVEIDPRIYMLGRQLHPEHPYDSPRVRMIVNDARAVFKQAKGPYDMVWFGSLDAHTLGSSYNNLRLDHYVYTLESFREAEQLLADDGLLVVNFASQRPWIADRLYVLAKQAFGHDPLIFAEANVPSKYGLGGGVTLVCSRMPVELEMIRDTSIQAYVKERLFIPPGTTQPTTDDWPYLYLQKNGIPKLHLVISLAILGSVTMARFRMLGNTRKLNWHFFALGVAFLLLEVETISRATLLFGMTWEVNAIVISGVLVMILLANLVMARWPNFPMWATVIGLAVGIFALAAVPLDWFNALSGSGKLASSSLFLTGPFFFAGMIFIHSFAVYPDKSQALGSNLIGALVGGLLESLSFVTGIRALILLVGIFYMAAIWIRPGENMATFSRRDAA